MSCARLGQSQVLTAVLLGGILVLGVGGAYMWGVPILQKNQDINNAQNSLSGMSRLSGEIAAVAQQGGSRSIPLDIGSGSLTINTENETITYIARTKGAYVATDEWVPLNENDMQGVPEAGNGGGYGVRGVDKPGVLIGRSTVGSNAYTTRYRIVFRPLQDPTSGQTFQINLVEDGRLEASGGKQTIVIQRQGTETIPGAGVDGGNLQQINVLIRIS